MLNMLDDIHRKFNKTDGLWQRLEEGCVSFYFLSIKQLGATDELYIKMNSRGKPLTEFEHFKAEWEGNIKEIEPKLTEEQKNNGEKTLSQTIGHKIDVDGPTCYGHTAIAEQEQLLTTSLTTSL